MTSFHIYGYKIPTFYFVEIRFIMRRDQLHFCTVMDSRQFTTGNRIFSLFHSLPVPFILHWSA